MAIVSTAGIATTGARAASADRAVGRWLLALSGMVGGVGGFGILSVASAMPILSVLLLGLQVKREQARALESSW